MKTKNKTKVRKSNAEPMPSYDIVRVNSDIIQQIKEEYPQYTLDVTTKTKFSTSDLDSDFSEYSFSSNGKLSKLSKGKRSFPKIDVEISCNALSTDTQSKEFCKISLTLSVKSGKLLAIKTTVAPINAVENTVPSVYDIFKIDFQKVFAKVNDAANQLYLTLSRFIG